MIICLVKDPFNSPFITAGLTAYEWKVERDKTAVCPLNRSNGYREKNIEKMIWYRPYSTGHTVPPVYIPSYNINIKSKPAQIFITGRT